MKHDKSEDPEPVSKLNLESVERQHLEGLGCSNEQIGAIMDFYHKEIQARVNLAVSWIVPSVLICVLLALALFLL